MRCHITPVSMALTKKAVRDDKYWQGCGGKDPRALLVQMQISAATAGGQAGGSSKDRE